VGRRPGKWDYRTHNGILLFFAVVIPSLLLWGEHRLKTSGLKPVISTPINIEEPVLGLEALALLLAITTFLVGFEVNRIASMLTDWKNLQARSLDRLLQLNLGDNLLPLPTTFKYQTLETPFAPGQDSTTRYMRAGIAAMGIVSTILLFSDVYKSSFLNLSLLSMQAVHIGICWIGCRIVQESEKAHEKHVEFQPEVCYQEFEAALDDYLKFRVPKIEDYPHVLEIEPPTPNEWKKYYEDEIRSAVSFYNFNSLLPIEKMGNLKKDKLPQDLMQKICSEHPRSKQRLEESIQRLDDSLPAWCWLHIVSAMLHRDYFGNFQIERIHACARETSKNDTYGAIANYWCSALRSHDSKTILDELIGLCNQPEFTQILEYARGQCNTVAGGDVYVELTLHSVVEAWSRASVPLLDVQLKKRVEQDLLVLQTLRRKRNRRPASHPVGSRTIEGADFEDVNLSDSILKYAKLSGANLRRANLRRADLAGANLQNANLEHANLETADLTGANLIGARLTGTFLRGATLTEADLGKAKIDNGNSSKPKVDAYLRKADPKGANLQDANLEHANLQGANLQGANLQVANLRGADLQDADLRDAELTLANLADANLTNADFTGAITDGTNFDDVIGPFIQPDGSWSSDS